MNKTFAVRLIIFALTNERSNVARETLAAYRDGRGCN